MRILIAIMLMSSICWGKTIKVAVLDTGFDYSKSSKVKLCPLDLHKSFSGRHFPFDSHGHGTNVAGLIAKGNENTNYCLIIVQGLGKNADYIKALEYVSNLDIDVVNISGGGTSYLEPEHIYITKMLNKGVSVVVAAGNEAHNLNDKCNYYPACLDPRIIVVGNTAKTSNRGRVVDIYLNGEEQEALGVKLSGSSQSTAIHTGNLLRNKEIVNNYILSAPIAWGGAPNTGQIVYDNPEREALRALSKALYIESGLNVKVKDWEKRFIPEYVKEYAFWPALLIRATTERRLSYEWTF